MIFGGQLYKVINTCITCRQTKKKHKFIINNRNDSHRMLKKNISIFKFFFAITMIWNFSYMVESSYPIVTCITIMIIMMMIMMTRSIGRYHSLESCQNTKHEISDILTFLLLFDNNICFDIMKISTI